MGLRHILAQKLLSKISNYFKTLGKSRGLSAPRRRMDRRAHSLLVGRFLRLTFLFLSPLYLVGAGLPDHNRPGACTYNTRHGSNDKTDECNFNHYRSFLDQAETYMAVSSAHLAQASSYGMNSSRLSLREGSGKSLPSTTSSP
jgi:hypothetical protein